MKVRVTYNFPPSKNYPGMAYSAIDDDAYDGAPDGPRSPVGHGDTPDEAVADLFDLMDYTDGERMAAEYLESVEYVAPKPKPSNNTLQLVVPDEELPF